jgi:hypothetical protein
MLPAWEKDTHKGIKFIWFLIATCFRFAFVGSADIDSARAEANRVADAAKEIHNEQ